MNEKLFEYFQVDKTVTEKELKKIYKQRIKILHPDAGGTHEEFIELNLKYKELSDYIKNKQHNESPFKNEGKSESPNKKDWKNRFYPLYNDFCQELSNSSLTKNELRDLIKLRLSVLLQFLYWNSTSDAEIEAILIQIVTEYEINTEFITKMFEKEIKRIIKFEKFKRSLTKTFVISGVLTIVSILSYTAALTASYSTSYVIFPIAIFLFLISSIVKLFYLPAFVQVLLIKNKIRNKNIGEVLFNTQKKNTTKSSTGKKIINIFIIGVLLLLILLTANQLLIALNLKYDNYEDYFLQNYFVDVSNPGIFGLSNGKTYSKEFTDGVSNDAAIAFTTNNNKENNLKYITIVTSENTIGALGNLNTFAEITIITPNKQKCASTFNTKTFSTSCSEIVPSAYYADDMINELNNLNRIQKNYQLQVAIEYLSKV